MRCGIIQCYLPPGRDDILAFTPAEAGTRFSDLGGMQGGVHLGSYKAVGSKGVTPKSKHLSLFYLYSSKNILYFKNVVDIAYRYDKLNEKQCHTGTR